MVSSLFRFLSTSITIEPNLCFETQRNSARWVIANGPHKGVDTVYLGENVMSVNLACYVLADKKQKCKKIWKMISTPRSTFFFFFLP